MENNRYREEEKELEEQAQQEATSNEETTISKEEVVENQEVKKEKKSTKNLKTEMKELEEQNQVLKEQIAVLQDLLLRNQAELENFKRRTNEERIRERKYAMQDFFEEIIADIDIFDQSINLNSKTEDEKLKKYLSGFKMINNKLKHTLGNYGVVKIEALGKQFDPAYHQATETVEVEGVETNIVVEVEVEGYLYKDRVLRPSMVKVSK